jgi:hypothetical protein
MGAGQVPQAQWLGQQPMAAHHHAPQPNELKFASSHQQRHFWNPRPLVVAHKFTQPGSACRPLAGLCLLWRAPSCNICPILYIFPIRSSTFLYVLRYPGDLIYSLQTATGSIAAHLRGARHPSSNYKIQAPDIPTTTEQTEETTNITVNNGRSTWDHNRLNNSRPST